MTVIRPPVTVNPRMNWRAWIAAGNVIPPPQPRQARPSWTAFVFVTGMTSLVAGVAIAEALR